MSNVEQTRYFTYLMIFLFLSLLVGLIFCVLTLSDMFQILRRRGER
ncbi:hypothetical protein [Thermogymnomonas acidicola]|nr:hypothetical protein [Thermogymnomonas acidicola]